MSAAASTRAVRNCLSCRRPFTSKWIGNRMCRRCNGGDCAAIKPPRPVMQPRVPFDREAGMQLLLDWLAALDGDLPSLTGIADAIGAPSAYVVWSTLDRMRAAGVIAWRSGTRSENRGHQAIRLVATGKTLRTAGCPFDPPGDRA